MGDTQQPSDLESANKEVTEKYIEGFINKKEGEKKVCSGILCLMVDLGNRWLWGHFCK